VAIFPLEFRLKWPLAANVNIYFASAMRLLIAGGVQQI